MYASFATVPHTEFLVLAFNAFSRFAFARRSGRCWKHRSMGALTQL